MIKLAQSDENKFHNFKCGEIFCLTANTYSVACCLCGTRVKFGDFPKHFQQLHLSLDEEQCIDINNIKKLRPNAANINKLPEPMKIEEDPIKHEHDTGDLEMPSISTVKHDEEFMPLYNEENDYYENDDAGIDVDNEEFIDDNKDLVKLAVEQKDTKETDDDEDEKPVAQLLGMRLRNTKKVNDSTKKRNVKSKIKMKKQTAVEKVEKPKLDDGEDDEKNIKHDNDLDAEADADADADVDGDWQFDEFSNDDDSDDYLVEKSNEKSKSKDAVFPCEECTRSYKSKRSLSNHIREKHDPSRPPKAAKLNFKCEDCGKEFRTERNLNGHRYKHTGIFCDICGKPFSQAGNMLRHRIRHTGIKSFKCKECEYSFYTDKELQAHMMRHTGIWPHICEICGRRCRDRGVLTAHMRRHTGERPAKCEVCGKSFFCGHDLNVHKVTHSTERPFACGICGSTFQRKKALRVHKKLHSKERNHVCKVCGKGFTMSSGLSSHMRSHDAATIASRSIDINAIRGLGGNTTAVVLPPTGTAGTLTLSIDLGSTASGVPVSTTTFNVNEF